MPMQSYIKPKKVKKRERVLINEWVMFYMVGAYVHENVIHNL
jgi:hypothetical protein